MFCAEDDEEWSGPREWHERILEGEWRITQEMVQREVGPEYEMYRFGTERE